MSRQLLAQRVQGEFEEMPGLKLSLAQAQRLLGLDGVECESVFRALMDARVLSRTRDGSYILASTGL